MQDRMSTFWSCDLAPRSPIIRASDPCSRVRRKDRVGREKIDEKGPDENGRPGRSTEDEQAGNGDTGGRPYSRGAGIDKGEMKPQSAGDKIAGRQEDQTGLLFKGCESHWNNLFSHVMLRQRKASNQIIQNVTER